MNNKLHTKEMDGGDYRPSWYKHIVYSRYNIITLHEHEDVMKAIRAVKFAIESEMGENQFAKLNLIEDIFKRFKEYMELTLEPVETELLEDNISDLQTKVTKLQSKISDLESEIESLQSEITILKYKNKKKKKKIEEMKETIRSLTVV